MAELFSADRIVPAWIAAVRRLDRLKNRTAQNFVLEITNPAQLVPDDLGVISAVNAKLLQGDKGLSIDTVSGTIFPNGLYRRYGRPDFYQRFLTAMKKGKDQGTWGTYALRMVQRTHPKTNTSFNPLEIIVKKLIRSKSERRIRAAYELGISDPVDLAGKPEHLDGFDLPLYDPVTDGGRPTNIPCLSHVSLKLRDDDAIDLTAVYRSHHYAQRALGNLIGLSQLQAFVARESGLGQGILTCISTQAHLDVGSWGGVAATKALLDTFPPT